MPRLSTFKVLTLTTLPSREVQVLVCQWLSEGFPELALLTSDPETNKRSRNLLRVCSFSWLRLSFTWTLGWLCWSLDTLSGDLVRSHCLWSKAKANANKHWKWDPEIFHHGRRPGSFSTSALQRFTLLMWGQRSVFKHFFAGCSCCSEMDVWDHYRSLRCGYARHR